jgi:hypothetical protein
MKARWDNDSTIAIRLCRCNTKADVDADGIFWFPKAE